MGKYMIKNIGGERMSQWVVVYDDELYHHGIKGQKWGIRRWQNEDGTLTPEGKKKYGTIENFNKAQKRKKIAIGIGAGVAGTAALVGAGVALGNAHYKSNKTANKKLFNDEVASRIKRHHEEEYEKQLNKQRENRDIAEKKGIVPKGFFDSKPDRETDPLFGDYGSIAKSLTPEKMKGIQHKTDSAITKIADEFVNKFANAGIPANAGPERYMGKHR